MLETYLNDFNDVLLRYRAFAAHDLLQYSREDRPLIHIYVDVDTIQMTELDKIGYD